MNIIKTTHSIVLSLIMTLVLFSSCSKDDDNNPGIAPENITIAIPDTNFEQALIDLEIDTNGLNGNILKTDAEAVTVLNVADKNISSLQGIEAFKNIELLECPGNELTNLDLSENLKLTRLNSPYNQLTNLEISNNIDLENILVSENNLIYLDISANTKLEIIGASANNLTDIDVSNNVVLKSLYLADNVLTSIDVSNNASLNYLYCANNELTRLNVKNGNNTNFSFFNTTSNFNLFCIEVDDVAFSNANWSSAIDGFSVFSEDCN